MNLTQSGYSNVQRRPVSVSSSTTIHATIPTGAIAGTWNVVVVNSDGQTGTGSNLFTVLPPPTFTSITPSVGNTGGGQSVTIVGTGFVSGGSLAVSIGGSPATGVTYSSSTSITAVTPSGTAGSKWVNITNGNGGTVNTTGAYTYVTPPTFTSITPSVGNTGGGQSVSIVGTGFVSGSSLAVTIGGSPAT